MNTIKIYLKDSGSIAELKKNFAMYTNAYQNKLIDVYVPKSILYFDESFSFANAVKIGGVLTADNGATVTTKPYYLNYLKEETVAGIDYLVYERNLPKELTAFAGNQQIVTNVYSIVNTDNNPEFYVGEFNSLSELQTETNGESLTNKNYGYVINNEEVSRYQYNSDSNAWELKESKSELKQVVTSQIANLLVQRSAYLDEEEVLEPNVADELQAKVTENQVDIANLKIKVATNEENIQTNTNDIAKNTNAIDELKELIATGENYIGTLTTNSLDNINTQLDNYVLQTEDRQSKQGDMVIVVYEIPNETDKNYKYIYNGTIWKGYEIPPIEEASNGTLGIIEGTLNIGSTNNTLVDISGGRILNILVKDNTGAYRNIREYLNGNNQTLQDIISGNQQVGSALKAVSDSLGNSIVTTYLTKELGATKQFVRDYAMPREFNDIYFIVSSGYQKEVPTTPASGIQFTASSSTIGDVELFSIEFENTADFELSSKNGYSNNIYVSSNANTSGQFRLTTQYKKTNGNWEDLNVELSSAINLVAGDIQKLTFGNPFTYLGENVISLTNGDLIRQTLEFVKTDSSAITLNVYSNEIYPSIFNLTSQSYSISTESSGKQIFMGADGVVEGQNVVFTVQNAESYIEYKENQTKFLITANLPLVGELDDSLTVRIEFGNTVYNVYSFMKGGATPLTIGDLMSVSSYNTNTGYSFYPNLIYIETSDIQGFVLDPETITASQIIEIIKDSEAIVASLDSTGTKVQLQLGAEILNKLMRVLVTPTNAPASGTYELPAVDDSNSQVMLTIGSGLTVLNGVLMSTGGGAGGGTIVTVGGVAQATFNADTKLDKNTTVTTQDQAYVKAADGTQIMVDFPTVEEIPD